MISREDWNLLEVWDILVTPKGEECALLNVDTDKNVKLGSISYGNTGTFVAISFDEFIAKNWILGPQTAKRLAEQKALRQFDKDLKDLLDE
jgi:hypothetical protein